ncbi:uncharacterized protein LOC119371382 [Jatropha curcas]|uniref:uncharacterized protein LOC119371382 n=1 Tax=Jatropha curcas TaxID=180498 RepID=UPI0018944B5A|nr:uncharacterized protein LOC119371382 [Jatropha curcas]
MGTATVRLHQQARRFIIPLRQGETQVYLLWDEQTHKRKLLRIVGYLDWWNDGHKRDGQATRGRAAIAVSNPEATSSDGGGQASVGEGGSVGKAIAARVEESGNMGYKDEGVGNFLLSPFNLAQLISVLKLLQIDPKTMSIANMVRNCDKSKNASWIFYCAATDTMTFDANDIKKQSKPMKTHVGAANGEIVPVEGAGTSGQERLLDVALSTKDCTTWMKLPNTCETCVLAKSHRQTFRPNNTRVDLPFSLAHFDVWGPAPVNNTRVDLPFSLAHFDVWGPAPVMGGKGLVHQTTCPHTPEQNGVAERKNRTLLEMTRALLIESWVPKSFWPEAVATATYILNRLPTKILDLQIPLQTLAQFTKVPPTLTLQPRIFGCSVFVHIPKSERSKFDPCTEKCVFVGYRVNQKGYRCYNPKTSRMFTIMNCDFLETEYFYITQLSGQGEKEYMDTLSWLPESVASQVDLDPQEENPQVTEQEENREQERNSIVRPTSDTSI